MLKQPEITIITPTYKREKELVNCIEQVKKQKVKISFEHLIISDGENLIIENICKFYKIKYYNVERPLNIDFTGGYAARDLGIKKAEGKYICFFDDDNYYYENALQIIYDNVKGFEIGICSIYYLKDNGNFEILPKNFNFIFELKNIDTLNFTVKTKLAKKELWFQFEKYGDFHWINKINKISNNKINYTNKIIGIHL